MNLTIPVFFSCDDNYCKYLAVTINSLIKSSNKDVKYEIYILESSISDINKEILKNQ